MVQIGDHTMTVDDFRIAMRAAEKMGGLLWIKTPDGKRHIALGMDSKRGIIICHGRVEVEMATATVAELEQEL